jgi:hypothetical protein
VAVDSAWPFQWLIVPWPPTQTSSGVAPQMPKVSDGVPVGCIHRWPSQCHRNADGPASQTSFGPNTITSHAEPPDGLSMGISVQPAAGPP